MDTSNSQIFGGSQEECHSSESGWTMYIGSPEDDDDGDQVENDVEDEYKGGGGDVESDDSMVSDASSAMAANMHNMYQKQVKEDDDVDHKKNSRKVVKKVEKNANQGMKKDKESAGMNVAPAQSGNKSTWLFVNTSKHMECQLKTQGHIRGQTRAYNQL
ncbi:hypothetical protein ACET3Z_011773 [Daucus carota]